MVGRRAPTRRLANLLNAAAIGLNDELEAAAGDHGLDLKAATALIALLDFTPSDSVRRLSQVIGLTHSGAVRLVDRLAAADYVRRSPGDDMRSLKVALTREGRTVALGLRQRREDAAITALAGVSRTKCEELTRACEAIIANLTEQRLAIRASGGVPTGGALCRLCDFGACGRASGLCPAASTAAAHRERGAMQSRTRG